MTVSDLILPPFRTREALQRASARRRGATDVGRVASAAAPTPRAADAGALQSVPPVQRPVDELPAHPQACSAAPAMPTLPPAQATPRDWHAHGMAWRDWGLTWVHRSSAQLTCRMATGDGAAVTAVAAPSPRTLTMHAYREAVPGPRWMALYDATWPAYRRWWLQDGEAARPSLAECRQALQRHMPELVPTWERLSALTARDPLAARLLSMWRLPAFAVGCAQAVVPGAQPVLVRNYDYDPALFEGVVASTCWSGTRKVIGTSDMLWGLLDGMNDDGLVVSLTFGGRQGSGPGFGIPLVVRYLLETCATVADAVAALRRIPVSQSYNVTVADRRGAHASVFVAPGQAAQVSSLQAVTNHRLDVVERPDHAARYASVERQQALLQLRADGAPGARIVDAMLAPPLRSDRFDEGFGTLYTAEYRPGDGTATWHWPARSWTRRFDDADASIDVTLEPSKAPVPVSEPEPAAH